MVYGRNIIRIKHHQGIISKEIKQTLGMIGAWSFLCFKPSQLKPSNHLRIQTKRVRLDIIS